MEDDQAQNPSDELEIVKMPGLDAGGGIDPQRVVVMCRIFEKIVNGVENLVSAGKRIL